MSLTLEQVRQVFPEAKLSHGHGHMEICVHCVCDERAPWKVTINQETGAYYCHKCQRAGNAMYEFFHGLDKYFPGLKIDRPTAVPTNEFFARGYDILWGQGKLPAPGECVMFNHLPDHHPAVEYMAARGFSKSEMGIDGFALLYCTKGQHRFAKVGTTTGRIILPLIKNGDVVGWQARQVEKVAEFNSLAIPIRKMVWRGEQDGWMSFGRQPDGKWEDHSVPKYYSCPNMDRGIFGFDYAKGQPLVVVGEGPLDAIGIGRPHGIGTIGKGITEYQIKIIKSYWEYVVLIQDKDVAEESDPRKIARYRSMLEELSKGVHFATFALQGYGDPGETPRKEIWNQIYENLRERPEFSPVMPLVEKQKEQYASRT